MNGDIVKRLREKVVLQRHADGSSIVSRANRDGDDAADEIERLRAELAAERVRADKMTGRVTALTAQSIRLGNKVRKLREALDMAVALLPEHRREYFDAVLKETGGGDE